MLSLAKLAPGGQQYYLDTVARGTEEYYTGAKEAPGQWLGHGAARLGLEGIVEEEALHRVLSHRDPFAGTRLTRAQGAPKVPGFDGTFNPAKSVSLLFTFGPPEVSNEVRNAQDAAVAAAFRFLEGQASRARRGKAGDAQVAADGFVAAAFRHRTSRAGDPHLHTHVLVANLVHAPHDGRWSALDARPLYGWARATGYLHEAQLRAELTRRLGVEWTPVRKGIAEIAGVPQATLRAFSRRRAEIEAQLDEWGTSGAVAAQAATYATRKPKDPETDVEGLLPEWRRRADALGFDAEAIAGLVGRAREVRVPTAGSEEAEALFREFASAEGLTARGSTFGRREVLQAICSALPNGGDIGDIVTLADAFLCSEHVLALDRPHVLRSSDVIRRADGRVVASYADEARFTTPELLEVEQRLLASAQRRRDEGVAVVGEAVVRTAILTNPSLSPEQVRMVRRLCSSGDGVEAVEGVAGSGKTTGLRVARATWEAAGYRVVGCALAARAARELDRGAGIPSVTLDRLLRDLDRRGPDALGARTVVVVDEAGMVGTRKLAKLLEHAERTGAKVVLVGDRHQLPAIDAGGAFAAIADRLGASRLAENRRQADEWERQALAEMRAGDVSRALDAYLERGRVHGADEVEVVRDQLVAEWWAARQAGQPVLMVATRNTDVAALNWRARVILHAKGHLGPDVAIGERAFAIGDEVLATRNDYQLGVLNGTRATVTALSAGGLSARTADGARLELPRDYIEAGHLTHAYATTIHKAQGATVGRALVVGDDVLAREPAYVGLSRGAARNDLFVVGGPEQDEEHHVPADTRDRLREAIGAMERSQSQRLASEQLPHPRLLAAEARGLARRLERDRPPDHSGELRRIKEQRDRLYDRLRGTERQLARVEGALDHRRGLRGLTRRGDRRQLHEQLAGIHQARAGLRTSLGDLERRAAALRPAQERHDAWEAEHRAEITRARMIDRLQEYAERQMHPAPTRERGIERGHGIGIEL